MPPFVYNTPQNPYALSIATALQQHGAIEAQRAETVANAQAQAATARGQAWGSALSNAGEDVARVMSQQMDPQRQLSILQLKAYKQGQQDLATANQLLPHVMNPDGTVNEDAVTKLMSSASYSPAVQKELLDTVSRIEAHTQTTKNTRLEAQADVGHLLYQALSGLPQDATPDQKKAAVLSVGALAKGLGHANDQDLQQVFTAINAGTDPMSVAVGLMGSSPSKRFADDLKPTVVPEGGAVMRPGMPTVTPTKKPMTGEEAQQSAYVASLNLPAGTTFDQLSNSQKAAYPQWQQAQKPKDEWQTFMDAYPKSLGVASWGQLSPAQQVEAYGKFAQSKQDPAMRDVALTLKQIQVGQQPTKEDAQNIAQLIVDHKMAPSQMSLFGGFGAAGAAFKRMVGTEAIKLDPNFNWEQAEADYSFSKTPGFQSTVRYMSSVEESMPRLLDTAKKLANSKVKLANTVENLAKTRINDPTLKAFVTDTLLVGDEVAKILQGGGTGSGTSDAKLQQAKAIFDTSDDVNAIASALNEVNALIGYRKLALTRGTYMEKAATSTPDLSGLQAGHARTFHDGPFAGQTWTVGANGQPQRVP